MNKYLPFLILILFVSCSQKTRFQLLDPDRTGIDFVNTIKESDTLHVMNFEYIYNGAGVGIADLNNDGLQDIFFTGNQVPCKVFQNRDEFKFSDITSSFPGLDNGQWYSGVTFVDINDDGWTDVYLTCTAYGVAEKRKNRFYINQGVQDDGRIDFKEMAESYGIDDESYSVQAAFFDYDRDGDLDLYLLNNFVNDRLTARYRAKVNDGTAVSNDDLYRNNGDGTFSNVTHEAGIIYEGFGLGLAMGDVNKDGYPDIYVSNDYISNDLLYINQKDGTFRNEIATYMSYQTKSSMGNDMADINNDGNPDMFTMDMLPEYYYKKKQTINGFAYIYYTNDEKFGYEHQFLRNMLHLHNGFVNGEMVPYSEVGQLTGIYQSEWSWSPLFADYDNDGDKDLLIANGYPRDMTDKDWTKYKAEVFGSVASPRHVISMVPAVKAYNYAFENNGELSFTDISGEWFDKKPSYSYGSAFVDLDNDGDLDYVVSNINDNAFVYRNNTVEKNPGGSNYIRIKLNGAEGNHGAFGAKIELWSAGGYQFQEHFLSRGYISSVDPVAHFGLKEDGKVDSLKVTWPSSGLVSVLTELQANQLVQIDETDAVPSAGESSPVNHRGSYFTRKEGVIDYVHQQDDFIDFYYAQLIIPHKFSQIGPRMQLGDLDGDGLQDIVVGATNTLPTMVFFRQGDVFKQGEVKGLSGPKEFSEAGFAILDVDLDGDNDVVALAGGYGNPDGDYLHHLYRNTNGTFMKSELPLPPFPASVVRPFDYDHDGDMDLFIGARIKPKMFPLADQSWILVNEGGSYEPEGTTGFNLGMVTDAAWSDYDGDGWEDLVITREWNSITVLKNLEGSGLQNQDIPELESMHGLWYSVTAADFDRDGDQDYIFGNLGENHRFTVSDQYPLRIYAFDLDLNGTLDPISTGYWKDQHDVMTEYPINYLDELVGQSPYFQKFKDYKSFSYTAFADMMDTSLLNRVDYHFNTNTTSSFILWNTEEGFEWEKLPRIAQFSPITRTIVDDFNHDGYPDVILAGNDHSFDIGTGYYDANKGLLLLSREGRPLSDLQTPSQSGLVLQGMVESLLYVEGDEPMIITGFNRKRAEAFSVLNQFKN